MADTDERRGVGRPKSDDPEKVRRGTALFSYDEWEQIKTATTDRSIAFSAWARDILLDEASRVAGNSSGTRLRLVLPDDEARQLTARARRVNYEKLSTMAEDVLLYLNTLPEQEFIKFALNQLMGGLLDEATKSADDEQVQGDTIPLRKQA